MGRQCPSCGGVCKSKCERENVELKKEWQGLTIEELQGISDSIAIWNSHYLVDVYYAIEAKLKEKNA